MSGPPQAAAAPRLGTDRFSPGEAQLLRRRPPDCPAPLWGLILRECGEDCLDGLRRHSGVIAAWSVELAACGEDRLCAFLRHLDDIHRRAAFTHGAVAEARNCEFRYRQELDAVGLQLAACQRELQRSHAMREEQSAMAGGAASELDRARFQVETLSAALEQANRRLIDASAHWEERVLAERQRGLAMNIGTRDECLAMKRALAAEREERAQQFRQSRDMVARLDASADEVLKKGREVAAMEQNSAHVQRSADSSMLQMEDWMRKTLAVWQRQRDEEVSALRRQLELYKLTGAAGVGADEADRSLLLVASLWHAAGRREPRAMTSEEESRCVDGALNSWRVYFHRELGAEPPLLRSTSTIILSPLRMVAGARAAEVLVGEAPALSVDLSRVSVPSAKTGPI